MARPLRINFPGAIYHVISRGNSSQPIYGDDSDRLIFLDILERAFERYHLVCHAYCLMENHYHLLIETPEGNLSEGMRQINGVYTRRFNARHEKSGHLFQGRFKAKLVERESYLLEVNRYISLNPVRSGLVSDPAEYAWSSFPAMIGVQTAPGFLNREWILAQFDNSPDGAMRKYREFVYDGMAQNVLTEHANETILGSPRFKRNLQGILQNSMAIREIPRMQRYVSRPALQNIFTSGTKTERNMRNAAIRKCVLDYGYSMKEVSQYLGLHYTTISKIVNQEEKI